MLHGGEWLVKKYASLARPATGNQTLDTTIATLASRLQDVDLTTKGEDGQAPPPTPTLQDRKAAVLTLKGLARDHPVEVGAKALPAILESLARDAPQDDEMARSIVEACLTLCEAAPQPGVPSSLGTTMSKDSKTPGHVLGHVEEFLASPKPLHALLPLLSPSRSFYTRFSSLQLLGLLLRTSAERVQEHVLTAPGGCGAVLECLSEGTGSSAEIIRNEALLLLPHLVNANADIQKLVAFEGAFEKLLDVVALEGRIEGGVVVQDALEALEALLRYNVSNQNYFRETLSVPMLAPLLFYPPPNLAGSAQAEQEYAQQTEAFAFQQWYPPPPENEEHLGPDGKPLGPPAEPDEQKVINASLVVGVAGLLVEGQGEGRRQNQAALLNSGFTKCLFELALASTAPLALKAQALNVLSSLLRAHRSSQDLLVNLQVSPILAISPPPDQAESNGEPAYTRLPPRPAVLELIGSAVNGPSVFGKSTNAGAKLAFRAAALSCFDAFVADNVDARMAIIGSMTSTGQDNSGALLLEGLAQFPQASASRPLDGYKPLISALLFAHLVRGSETAKKEARSIIFGPDGKPIGKEDREQTKKASKDNDDDDDSSSLIQVIVGNLTMATREHGEATRRERGVAGGASARTAAHAGNGSPTDWSRITVGYLLLLATWLWDSKESVWDFLSESANLQVLIQPVAQAGGNTDALVSGLCALVLGIAYEYGPTSGKEEGSGGEGKSEDEDVVTRATMHPILHSRIGPDQFAARLHRLRDDARFKAVAPDVLETVSLGMGGYSGAASVAARARDGNAVAAGAPGGGLSAANDMSDEHEGGLWFDWPFVDFVKSNYVLIQKSILVDPSSSTADQASQSAELLDAQRQAEQLRESVAKHAREAEQLDRRLNEERQRAEEERNSLIGKLEALQVEVEGFKKSKAEQEVERMKSEEERKRGEAQKSQGLEEERKKWEEEKRQMEEDAKRERAKAQEDAKRDFEKLQKEAEEHKGNFAKEQERSKELEEQVKRAKEEAAAAKPVPVAVSDGNTKDKEVDGEAEGEKSKAELEKELEDLLILLDELSTKRKADKKRMREKGMEVSEDEEDDDDDEDEDDVD